MTEIPQFHEQIAVRLKEQQSTNVRDQILRQFGVASAKELLDGPKSS